MKEKEISEYLKEFVNSENVRSIVNSRLHFL
jgi:hypothetical protein